MARTLATHDRLISTVVVDHGGRLVRPRVRATAPRVSSTARRRWSSPPWSCNGPLPPSPGHYRRRWRWIAIHAGNAQEREADFLGRIALGRRFGPGMTQPRRHRRSWTTGRRQPAAISKRIPQHAVRRTTGVPDLFPGPVLASLRANPDRPAFEIGPRTVSRGDLLAMVRRLAAPLRDADLGPGRGVGCCRERRGRRRVRPSAWRRPGERGSAGDRRRRGASRGRTPPPPAAATAVPTAVLTVAGNRLPP
jgi:hypothetical protein